MAHNAQAVIAKGEALLGALTAEGFTATAEDGHLRIRHTETVVRQAEYDARPDLPNGARPRRNPFTDHDGSHGARQMSQPLQIAIALESGRVAIVAALRARGQA
jgi:hypothetical protein